jgi:hypothetical protein
MKKISLIVTVLTLVAFVAVATAQQPAPAKPATTPAPAPAKAAATPAPAKAEKAAKAENFTGDVAKVDAMAKTVVVKGKKGEMTFVTDDKTKITMSGKDMPLGDLKEGMGAHVSYKKSADKNLAASIKVAAPKAAPAAKAKPATTKK